MSEASDSSAPTGESGWSRVLWESSVYVGEMEEAGEVGEVGCTDAGARLTFARRGYVLRENVLLADECIAMLDAISAHSTSLGAGVRNLMSCAGVASLARDQRLLDIGMSLTGCEMIPYKAILFNKTGKANWLVTWHQDVALPVEREFVADGWGPFTIKAGIVFAHAPTEALRKILALRIHLDPSTSTNGPLRVVPGSHKRRLSNDAKLDRVVENAAPVALTVGRGAVIAMSPLLVHASSKCSSDEPRRVLHIEYAPSRDIAGGGKLALA